MEERAKWLAPRSRPAERPCAVPGCPAPATATLRTDPGAPHAWLVDLAPMGTGDDLCAHHADELHASGDWVLHDERGRTPRRRGRSVGALRSRPLAPPPPAPLPGLDLRRPAETESVDDLLAAKSPLLARAFSKSRR